MQELQRSTDGESEWICPLSIRMPLSVLSIHIAAGYTVEHSTETSESFVTADCVSGRVSVIIPAYNRCSMIGDAVCSALDQTYSDVEVIVVDDGSTDDTALTILNLIARYGGRRLRYDRQAKSGAPAARNRGAQLSRGEYIQFFDSDDILHKEKLAKQVAVLRERPDLDMTYCITESFDKKPGDLAATRLLYQPEPDVAAFVKWPIWDTNAPLWRRDAIARVGPWAAGLLAWQDWEYHIRAISLRIKAAGVGEVLSYLREHSSERIDAISPTLEKLRSFGHACALAAQHLDRMGVGRGPAREALANRARGVAYLFFEKDAPNDARAVLALALSQRPSFPRRAYMRLLMALSFLPKGSAMARAVQSVCPTLGQIARRRGLLPQDQPVRRGQAVGEVALKFKPRG